MISCLVNQSGPEHRGDNPGLRADRPQISCIETAAHSDIVHRGKLKELDCFAQRSNLIPALVFQLVYQYDAVEGRGRTAS